MLGRIRRFHSNYRRLDHLRWCRVATDLIVGWRAGCYDIETCLATELALDSCSNLHIALSSLAQRLVANFLLGLLSTLETLDRWRCKLLDRLFQLCLQLEHRFLHRHVLVRVELVTVEERVVLLGHGLQRLQDRVVHFRLLQSIRRTLRPLQSTLSIRAERVPQLDRILTLGASHDAAKSVSQQLVIWRVFVLQALQVLHQRQQVTSSWEPFHQ